MINNMHNHYFAFWLDIAITEVSPTLGGASFTKVDATQTLEHNASLTQVDASPASVGATLEPASSKSKFAFIHDYNIQL